MLEVGSTFGPYRLEAVLGQGGMGVVYEATQLSLDRDVALKVVAPQLSADDGLSASGSGARGRSRRASTIRTSSPCTRPASTSGHLFLAMRLVRGPKLKDLILARELDPRGRCGSSATSPTRSTPRTRRA